MNAPKYIITPHASNITRTQHEVQNNHKGGLVWLTGLSGAGKSTLAYTIENYLHHNKYRTVVLDGDNIRHGLCNDLSFSIEDRRENLRRASEVAKLFVETGTIVIATFISPSQIDREMIRNLFHDNDFIEVYCNAPLEICEQRDTKGLYKKARAGEIQNFTGISAPYEPPIHPELILYTGTHSLNACKTMLIEKMKAHGFLRKEETYPAQSTKTS